MRSKTLSEINPNYKLLRINNRRDLSRPEMSLDEYRIEFGYTPNNLRYLMTKHRLRHEDVAAIIGIERNNVIRYSSTGNNRSEMPFSSWMLLLNHLGYSGQYLVSDMGVSV